MTIEFEGRDEFLKKQKLKEAEFILTSLNNLSEKGMDQLVDFILLGNVHIISGERGINPITNNISGSNLRKNIDEHKENLQKIMSFSDNEKVKTSSVLSSLSKMSLFTGINKELIEKFISFKETLISENSDPIDPEGQVKIDKESRNVKGLLDRVLGE